MHHAHVMSPEPLRPSLRGIDLNMFVLCEAIYSAGGLTAAAARLGLTQPAVSHALSRLRIALSDPLFVRQGARVVPTPLARSIVGDVRRALKILQERLDDHRRFDPRTSNAAFRLALPEATETGLLPALMARLAQEAPGVSIMSARVSRRDFESELASGALDLVIDVAAPVGIDIRRSLLAADRLVVAARRGHPALDDGLTLEAYLQLGHIQVSSRRRGGAFEDFELNRLGLRRTIALRCHSMLAALSAVAASDLLLTLGERQLAPFAKSLALKRFQLPFEAAAVDLQLYWHANADDDPANSWLRNIIALSTLA
jgi:DNA-binding transcriptional LysR family regulator